MRVLFIGNGNMKFFGLRHFGIDTRIYNGLVRNGHCVYFFSDRDEVIYNSPLRIKPIGVPRTNQKLLKIARNFQPEAIVLGHVDIISIETLKEMKALLPGLRIAHVNVDALFSPKNIINLKKRSEVCDATFITTGGAVLKEYASAVTTCYFLPNISDRSIDTGTAFAQEQPEHDLACFFNANPDRPQDEAERIGLANNVAKNIPELRTFYRGFNGTAPLRGLKYQQALANSAMALSLSKTRAEETESTPATRHLYSSDRIAHVMGNGALALIEKDFDLDQLFANDEAVFFKGLEELTEKIRFYKNNPAARTAIAKKGWQKAQGEFNETVAMKYVMERLFEKPLSQDYAWPTTAFKPA